MITKEDFEEICLERARFLLSTDELLEQVLNGDENIISIISIQENDSSGIKIEA